MTKKDFQLIAKAIFSLDICTENKRYIASNFANYLSSSNRSFDSIKFIKACVGE